MPSENTNTEKQLQAFAAAITADYFAGRPHIGNEHSYSIGFEKGKKYIRVVRTSFGQRSVHSFIEIENGNIWKAASWKVPAKNHPRGKIASLTPNVCRWTGAS